MARISADSTTKLREQMLASAPSLLTVLCRVQFLAEYPGSPVRYVCAVLLNSPAHELCHYAVATAMRGIVVQDQIIGVLTDFEEFFGDSL